MSQHVHQPGRVSLHTVLIAGAAALAVSIPSGAIADSIAEFYAQREMSVIMSGSPGSVYDTFTRMVTRHMANHIPGRPNMVPRNMTGGGHMIATNHLYNVAAQDGSVLGQVGNGIPLAQLMHPERAKFDARNFNWIGNPSEVNSTVVAWHETGITSIEQLREKELIVGGTGAASPSIQVPRMLQNVLGYRLRIIAGFRGSSELDLAMERNEIGGRGSVSYEWWRAGNPRYLNEKKINFLAQIGFRREADLPDVPLLTELARSEAERRMFALISSGIPVGRPILTTPNVPSDRVAALRQAFDATMKDAAFLTEAKKQGLTVNVLPGDKLQKVIEDIVSTPSDVVALLQTAITKGQTFDCVGLMNDAALCAQKKKKKK